MEATKSGMVVDRVVGGMFHHKPHHPKPKPHPEPAPTPPLPSMSTIGVLLNIERHSRNLSLCTYNSVLASVAQQHSVDMAQHHNMTHNRSNGSNLSDNLTGNGYHFAKAGEIILAANGNPLSESDIVALWMKSSEHSAIILDPAYREFGPGESEGYYTVEFGVSL